MTEKKMKRFGEEIHNEIEEIFNNQPWWDIFGTTTIICFLLRIYFKVSFLAYIQEDNSKKK